MSGPVSFTFDDARAYECSSQRKSYMKLQIKKANLVLKIQFIAKNVKISA